MDTGIAKIADEVADALTEGGAVVALESTLLAHGLPPGRNLEVGRRLEQIVREHGAVPATIAVLDGRPTIGLSDAELKQLRCCWVASTSQKPTRCRTTSATSQPAPARRPTVRAAAAVRAPEPPSPARPVGRRRRRRARVTESSSDSIW